MSAPDPIRIPPGEENNNNGGGAPAYQPATPEFVGEAAALGGAPTAATPPYAPVSPAYGGEAATPPYAPVSPSYGGEAATPPYVPASPAYGAATPPYVPATPRTARNLPGGTADQVKLHGANPNTVLSRKILDTYFSTFDYPFTRHHIDSFDQFIGQDLPAMIQANNPFLLIKGPNEATNQIQYKIELFVGGPSGTEIEIGSPTLSLQRSREVRVLFPNEARLRNLTYASTVFANILVRVTIQMPGKPEPEPPLEKRYERLALFQIPILLHSRYCMLHGKPASLLEEVGECPQDQGGYFIVDGAEKVLITRQEQAFNVLYCMQQPNDPQIATYGNITCLSPVTREVKIVSFLWNRKTDSLHVTLPFVRHPVPVVVLFRALGIQSDEEIFKLIYPDLEGSEARQMMPLLLPSVAEACPFFDQFSAVQFIKAMTKGFSEFHVYDILQNKTFIHITDKYGSSRAHFLAECVRQFMRVHTGIEGKTDRDDTRNQRCLTSGFLVRMLFSGAYGVWKKGVRLAIDREYEFHRGIYVGSKFMNIFSDGNTEKIFNLHLLTEGIMRGFKGKWVTGGSGGGGALGHSDEKTGVLQALSRLSYLDFMSHTRRVNLNFDTGMKLTGPRQFHGSQYGYYCTHETPSGASIGITKNLTLMTLISTATPPDPFTRFLFDRAWVIPCSEMRNDLQKIAVAVYVNNGIIGYTLQPFELTRVLKLLKWTACLPPLCSVGFNVKTRRVFVFLDEGRPCRPLVHLPEGGKFPSDLLASAKSWRNLVCGTLELTAANGVSTTGFVDPLKDTEGPVPLARYSELLEPQAGLIEYVDPYEQNEALIANFPEQINQETSHCEIHPSTIVSIVNGMIPFANYNQSPRNQLSCSQSKQGLGLYATNFQNRYDNSVNILSYGEAPLVRTYTYDKLGSGKMPYGANVILAIMPFHGFNRDDGIIFNLDSFQRGLFRSLNYRSYECAEEIDPITHARSTIANPHRVPSWVDLRPGIDYGKLDDRGIIRVGELVDETTVLVGRYVQDRTGKTKDASLTAQVWTSGRVESVLVTVDNQGLQLVKIRVTQDRVPELGDKFSTRHGQKGTMGMGYRAHDMPRTASGLVPDMVVNPHCIPSRMTVGQLLEILFGKVCYQNSMIGDATLFTSDASAPEAIGRVLQDQYGMEKAGNEIMYDGETGVQMATSIFIGPCFAMRLKHMTEDKWNARAEGRKEQRTHQPTGGRGAQGGLRIGEMERDALAGHGVMGFLRESLMERADKTQFRICNGCGTVPIFNDKQKLFICPLCDGPVRFIGTRPENMELLPTVQKSLATTSIVEMPYATKLLADELQTYMNMGMRFLTSKGVQHLKMPPDLEQPEGDAIGAALKQPLGDIVFPEARIPEYREAPEETEAAPEDLAALGLLGMAAEEQEEEEEEEDLDALGEGLPALEAATPEGSKAAFVAAGYTNTPFVPTTPPIAPPAENNVYQVEPGVVFNGGLGKYINMYSGNEIPGYIPPNLRAPQQGSSAAGPGGPSFAAPPLAYAPVAGNTPPYSVVTPPGAPGGPQQPVMIGGAMQQMMMQQPHMMMQPQMPFVMGSPTPNGPPTIVINTTNNDMPPEYVQEEMEASQGRRVMGGGSRMGGRHVTPRARQMSPSRQRRGPASLGEGQPPAPSQRITVNKLG